MRGGNRLEVVALGKMILLMLISALSLAEPSYRLSPADSDIRAKVSFFGLASKTARFPAMQGTVAIDPDDPSDIDLVVVLDARRLQAGDRTTLRRLKSEKFFWVERYPEIRFSGSDLELRDARSGRMKGTVTARGVTRPVELDVTFDRAVDRFGDGGPVRIEATTEIDRRDFGMNSYRSIVGKRVKISIDALMRPVT